MESQHTSCLLLPLAISCLNRLFLIYRLWFYLDHGHFHSPRQTSDLFQSHHVLFEILGLYQLRFRPLWLRFHFPLRDLILIRYWPCIGRYTIDETYLKHYDCLPITVSLSNGKSLPSVPVIINQVNKITNRVIIPLELSLWCFIQNSFLLLSLLFSSLTQDRIPMQRLISPRLVNLVYVKKR